MVKVRRAKAIIGFGLAATLVACGTAPPSAAPVATPTVTATTPTPTTPTPATTSTSSVTPSSSGTPTGPPIVVSSPGSGKQVLLLADAFDKGQWEEGSYTPANETAAVKNAMAISVRCTDDRLKPLEYRFAQVRGKITVQVAQDMRSTNPDLELEFALVADGRQLEAKNVKFKDKAELTTDLAGVTVLRIGVRAAPAMARSCPKYEPANALITSVTVEQ